MVNMLQQYLNHLSNRDFKIFNEEYVKLLIYSIAMNFKNLYLVKSEYEVQRKYPDLIMIAKEKDKGYHSYMIECKYIKKKEGSSLEAKQKEAREQIQEYSMLDEFKDIPDFEKYTVVAVADEVYVEKID